MKTRLIITTIPVMVVGGMILFLGCGAQTQKANRAETGSSLSAATVAATPAATNLTAAPVETVPKIVITPPKLSPGVEEIVQLAQAGVGDEVLQAYIENSPVAYKLNVDELLYLHDLGLSAETIAAIVRHSQPTQEPPATLASANTNVAATPVGPPEGQTALAQEANTNPVPAVDGAQVAANADAITPPQQVNYNYFYQNLAPYGTWVEVPDYGWCWQPTVAVIDVGWRPYCNSGRWLWTDCGWYWQSDYSWGWAPFHYGRWCRSPRHGWVWAPDTTWGPAWVTWRYSDTYCGWAPLPPGAYFDVGIGFRFGHGRVGVGFDFGLVPDCFTFIPTAFFCDHRPWRHCIPRTQIVNIFHRTTIINNYGASPNGRAIVNVGPGRDAIASVTRTEIRKVALRDANPADGTLLKPDRLDRNSSTLAVFRPKLPEQSATPPTQIIRHQQEFRKSTEVLTRNQGMNPVSAGAARGTPGASPSPQTAQRSLNTSPLSRNLRSERRSSGTAQSAPAIVRPYQTEPAPRPLAEVSPRTFEPRVPNGAERSPVYQPQLGAQPEIRPQPTRREPIFPPERAQSVYQPPSSPQAITPPQFRQEGRKMEPPAYMPSAPVRPAAPAPYAISPRAPESRFSSPGYQPPQNFSPPPISAPRAIEAPAVRHSSPPPSYSAPPAASRAQPAPSSSPGPSRSEGGRRP